MSWQGPSAPRVEGIATKSRVVANCASKLASTASAMRCLMSFEITAFALVVVSEGDYSSTDGLEHARLQNRCSPPRLRLQSKRHNRKPGMTEHDASRAIG